MTTSDAHLFGVKDYFAAVVGDTAITTDGVGSKIQIAEYFDNYAGIGIDCVAMNVNDLLCVGATPTAMVDYITMPERDESLLMRIAASLHHGCSLASVPLVGGETAIIQGHSLDVSGTAIGKLRTELGVWPNSLLGQKINNGDPIFGFPSSGIHANGLTLARTALGFDRQFLEPTKIYTAEIASVKNPKAIVHITGGGWNNVYRVPTIGRCEFNYDAYEIPNIFKEIQASLDLSANRMYSTFNMGIGMMVVCDDQPPNSIHLGHVYTR